MQGYPVVTLRGPMRAYDLVNWTISQFDIRRLWSNDEIQHFLEMTLGVVFTAKANDKMGRGMMHLTTVMRKTNNGKINVFNHPDYVKVTIGRKPYHCNTNKGFRNIKKFPIIQFPMPRDGRTGKFKILTLNKRITKMLRDCGQGGRIYKKR